MNVALASAHLPHSICDIIIILKASRKTPLFSAPCDLVFAVCVTDMAGGWHGGCTLPGSAWIWKLSSKGRIKVNSIVG